MTPGDVTRILERLSALEATIDAKLQGHVQVEERLRKVERWQAGLAGCLALIALELQAVGVTLALMARW